MMGRRWRVEVMWSMGIMSFPACIIVIYIRNIALYSPDATFLLAKPVFKQ